MGSRRFGGAGIRRGIRSSAAAPAAPLLNYTGATFTRSGEAALVDPRGAWAFYDLTAPWKATNVPRILGDGSVLLEGSRTNLVPESENLSTWALLNTPVVTGGNAAPDGASDAYTIEDNSATLQEGIVRNEIVAGATAYTAHVRIKKDAITSRFPEVQITEVTGGVGTVCVQLNTSTGASAIRTQSGLTSVTVGVLDAGDWWILWIKFTTTGATTAVSFTIYPAFGLTLGASDVSAQGTITAWGAQLEAGTFQTSIVRTAGASATRGGELLSFATIPAAIQSGRWKIAVSPVHGQGAAAFVVAAQGATANEEIGWDNIAGRFVVRDGGVLVVSSNVITWNPNTRILLTFDAGAGSINVSGALTGDGTVVGSSWSWPNTTTHFGARSNGLSPAYAVFERPRAA